MIEDEKRIALYKAAIQKWGETAQLDQAIEECAELIVAINKYKRVILYGDSGTIKDVTNNIKEEAADVSIMIEQLETMFGGGLDDMKTSKLTKMEEHLRTVSEPDAEELERRKKSAHERKLRRFLIGRIQNPSDNACELIEGILEASNNGDKPLARKLFGELAELHPKEFKKFL